VVGKRLQLLKEVVPSVSQVALLWNPDNASHPLHRLNVEKIIDFLVKNRLPGMFQEREIVVAGGFMSYGASVPDLFRRGALYVHKILQGTKPTDLPVEQPVKFDLAVNVKTAKAIGLSVPESFLLRADEVIE